MVRTRVAAPRGPRWPNEAILRAPESFICSKSRHLPRARRAKAEIEAEVCRFVEEAIEELRDATLDRASTTYRHQVIQFEGRNVEPAEANRAAREAMQDRDTMLRLTRGKDLLARVRDRISGAYAGTSFGNIAILKEMQEAEVDPELWHVLDEVEAL